MHASPPPKAHVPAAAAAAGADRQVVEAVFDRVKGVSGIDRRLRPGRSATSRFAFEVPTRTVQGLVFQGQPGDAYAAILWIA